MKVCFEANLQFEKWFCWVPPQLSTGFPPTTKLEAFRWTSPRNGKLRASFARPSALVSGGYPTNIPSIIAGEVFWWSGAIRRRAQTVCGEYPTDAPPIIAGDLFWRGGAIRRGVPVGYTAPKPQNSSAADCPTPPKHSPGDNRRDICWVPPRNQGGRPREGSPQFPISRRNLPPSFHF